MNKKQAFLIALAVCAIARADVVVYQHKLTGTLTGAGSTDRSTSIGYTLMDVTSHDLVSVEVFPDGNQFQVTPLTNWYVAVVTGKGAKSYSFFIQATPVYMGSNVTRLDSGVDKGLNVLTDIGNKLFTKAMVPKSMQSLRRSAYLSLAGEVIVAESSGTLKLDPKMTSDANFFGDGTMTNAVEGIRQLLLDKGFSELQ